MTALPASLRAPIAPYGQLRGPMSPGALLPPAGPDSIARTVAPAQSAAERQIVDAVAADKLMGHVADWAKAPRPGGSQAMKAAAELAVTKAPAGWQAAVEQLKVGWRDRPVYNVVFKRDGTGPSDQRKIVFGGAHLDSVPRGPGANDNASGAATMIESMAAMPPTYHDQWYVLFDREEEGLRGSAAYVNAHADDLERAVVMLNADMVASPGGGVGFSQAPRTSAPIEDVLRGVAERNAIAHRVNQRTNRSDHASFAAKGVPAAHFGVDVRTVDKDDPNYHTSRDTIDKLNPVTFERATELFALSMYHFAQTPAQTPAA